MGIIIHSKNFSLKNQLGLIKPIIYCLSNEKIATKAVAINIMLSKKLIEIEENQKSILLEKFFLQVLDILPDEVIIKDFDVMFNPKYKVDLLKIIILTYKKKPFSIIWPGKYENGFLFYAEEGYSDYKKFRVSDYDVTCII